MPVSHIRGLRSTSRRIFAAAVVQEVEKLEKVANQVPQRPRTIPSEDTMKLWRNVEAVCFDVDCANACSFEQFPSCLL
jgi:hypothetical protein